MTHIVKQKIDPISAITLSNDGQTMAINVMSIVTPIRIPPLTKPRYKGDIPTRPSEAEISRGPSPTRCSIVLKIGRELSILDMLIISVIFAYFKGNLVIGMIAIQTAIITESALGYPSVRNMFDVISSRVRSPNINKPTIATLTSNKNCLYVSNGLCMRSFTNRETKSNLQTTIIFLRMSHISIYVWEHSMATPWRH
jgi:hypothetical protein